MASTVFQDYNQNNPIVASWLNDVNNGVYTPGKVPKQAIQSSAAWARFQIVGGIVTIQQSSNVASVTRTSTGVYVVTYGSALTNINNCYGFSMNSAGFMEFSAETAQSVTLNTLNTSNVAFDPGTVSVVIYGAN